MARPIPPRTLTLPSLPPTFSNLFISDPNGKFSLRCADRRTVPGSDIDDDDLTDVTPWGACSCSAGKAKTDACISQYYKNVDESRDLLPPELFKLVEKEYRKNLSFCLCIACKVFCGWNIPDNQIPGRVVNTRQVE